MDLEVLKGKEIARYKEPFIEMRMAFYRAYPYLYAGNKQFERKYFDTFVKDEDSRLIVAKEEGEIVGMIIGAPLHATFQEVWRSIKEVDSIYFLADLLVVKEYRGKGIGSALYEEFESVIRRMKKYKEIDLYELTRSQSDPKKPVDYKPFEEFWVRRGFHLEPNRKVQLFWKEIGQKQESPHSLVAYFKKVA